MFKRILNELKVHAPFTAMGSVAGIVIMVIFRNLPFNISYNMFYIFHPGHVILSAFVTTSMYKIHKYSGSSLKSNIWPLLAIGYVGSIGIATLSDSLLPYLGEAILGMPNRELHLGFIEKWWFINPVALLGIGLAYLMPSTKFPHFGHILLSTLASLLHIMMASTGALSFFSCAAIFFILFIAVWLPCCTSDIVFPLLFIKDPVKEKACSHCH